MGQTCFYISIPIDEFHALLETPEEALGALETSLEQPDQRARAALLLPLLNLVLEVLEYDPDQLDEGDDEGAEGGGAEVEADQAVEGAQHGAHPNAILDRTQYKPKVMSDVCTLSLAKYQPATAPAITRCWHAMANCVSHRNPNM